jgi:hypothetical protein
VLIEQHARTSAPSRDRAFFHTIRAVVVVNSGNPGYRGHSTCSVIVSQSEFPFQPDAFDEV